MFTLANDFRKTSNKFYSLFSGVQSEGEQKKHRSCDFKGLPQGVEDLNYGVIQSKTLLLDL